jgi:hypothetical protein
MLDKEKGRQIFQDYLNNMRAPVKDVPMPKFEGNDEGTANMLALLYAMTPKPKTNQDIFDDAVARAFQSGAGVLLYGRLKKEDRNFTEFRKMWNEKWGEEFAVELGPEEPKPEEPKPEEPKPAPVIPEAPITPREDNPNEELPQLNAGAFEGRVEQQEAPKEDITLNAPKTLQQVFLDVVTVLAMVAIAAGAGAAVGLAIGSLGGPAGMALGIILGAAIGGGIMLVASIVNARTDHKEAQKAKIAVEDNFGKEAPGPHAKPIIKAPQQHHNVERRDSKGQEVDKSISETPGRTTKPQM